jgi:hypothetical protein
VLHIIYYWHLLFHAFSLENSEKRQAQAKKI